MSNFFVGDATSAYPRLRLLRDATFIFIGDAYGSATQGSAAMHTAAFASTAIISVGTTYLDSPATTSAVTYKWQIATFSSRAAVIGATSGSSDGNNMSVPSTITLMEVAS